MTNKKFHKNTALTVVVIAFATFIVAGLAIIPAFDIQDADAKGKKPKKGHDLILQEPTINLVNNNEDKVQKFI